MPRRRQWGPLYIKRKKKLGTLSPKTKQRGGYVFYEWISTALNIAIILLYQQSAYTNHNKKLQEYLAPYPQ